jgi:hypothetical protein
MEKVQCECFLSSSQRKRRQQNFPLAPWLLSLSLSFSLASCLCDDVTRRIAHTCVCTNDRHEEERGGDL